MIKKKNLLWLVAVTVISVFTFTACGGNNPPPPDLDPIYLLFTSDPHWNNNSRIETQFRWVEAVKSTGITIEYFAILGDLANGSQSVAVQQYWDFTQTFMDGVDSYMECGFLKNPGIFMKGNHEYFDYEGITHGGVLGPIEGPDNPWWGDTTRLYDRFQTTDFTHPAIARLSDIHTVYTTPRYVLYDLGAVYTPGISDGCLQQFSRRNVDELERWFRADAPKDRPIFVMAHHPIHSMSQERTTQRSAERLVDVLNEFSATHDIYFLWGHNHTRNPKDILYDRVHLPGSSLMVIREGEWAWGERLDKEIKFTYVSPGSFADADYGSASTLVRAKGMLVTVRGRGNVEFLFYDREGVSFHHEGVAIHGREANIKDITVAGVSPVDGIPEPISRAVWDAAGFRPQQLSDDQTGKIIFDDDTLLSNAAISVTPYVSPTVTFAVAIDDDIPAASAFTSAVTRDLINAAHEVYLYVRVAAEDDPTVLINYYRFLIVNDSVNHAQRPVITADPKSHVLFTGDTIPTLSVVIGDITDGGDVTYEWFQVAGTTITPVGTASSFTPNISNAEVGSYTYYVTVTNTNNAVDGIPVRFTTSANAVIRIIESMIPGAISPFQLIFNETNTTAVSGDVTFIDGGWGYEFTRGGGYGASWVRLTPQFPGNAALADYDRIHFTIEGVQGDFTYKHINLLGGSPLPAASLGASAQTGDHSGVRGSLSVAESTFYYTNPGIYEAVYTIDKERVAELINDPGKVELTFYDPSAAASGVTPTMWRITNVVFIKDVEAPTITVQPQSHVLNVGDPIPQLSVTATISEGSLSYQWYNMDKGVAVPVGTDTPTFTPVITEAGAYTYYVVVTGTNNIGQTAVTFSDTVIIRYGVSADTVLPFYLIFNQTNTTAEGPGSIVEIDEDGLGYVFTYGTGGSGFQNSWVRIRPSFPAGTTIRDYNKVTLTVQGIHISTGSANDYYLAIGTPLPATNMGSGGERSDGPNVSARADRYLNLPVRYTNTSDNSPQVLTLELTLRNKMDALLSGTGPFEMTLYEHAASPLNGQPIKWRVSNVVFE